MAPPTTTGGIVNVIVRAESEDDHKYEWRQTLSITEKVQKVAHSWASAHGVPPAAVGLDDLQNMEVNLLETPAELGWSVGQDVYLKAFPTEERYMEQGENPGENHGGEEDAGGVAPSATAGARSRSPARAPPPAAPVDGAPPSELEEIVYLQDNPKRMGSSSYDRYELYKTAQTVAQAMALGAIKGDIAHDWKRGFLKRKRS
mmetsp:Transcript_45549/g.103446  ORF Transcript_45549/g.103446 Transcript_45549/m.103446 type:complete len:202 (-) Transcript_45549:185-790(-)